MGRNICGIKQNDRLSAAEYGRRFEVFLDSKGLKHRQYYKGYMAYLFQIARISPDHHGKWLGKEVIPIMKAELERVENNSKNKKAKPADTQTPQTFKENLNNDAISSISHQVSIEEIKEPQYLKDLDELRQKLCEAADLIAKAFEDLLGGF